MLWLCACSTLAAEARILPHHTCTSGYHFSLLFISFHCLSRALFQHCVKFEVSSFTAHLVGRPDTPKVISLNTMQSSKRYECSPLNEEHQEIRILTLLPGSRSSDIRISIETAILTKESVPQYEALSYVWGSKENLINIYVAHGNGELIAITQNLHVALQHLRHEEQPRRLWIDAICINQQSLKERGSQVQRMGDIYKLAERMVIWLGPEDETSGSVFGIIRQLSSKVEINWVTFKMTPVSPDDNEWADYKRRLPYDINTLHVAYRFFNRRGLDDCGFCRRTGSPIPRQLSHVGAIAYS